VGSLTSSAAAYDQQCHERYWISFHVFPSFLSVGGTSRSTLLEEKGKTNGSDMGESIMTKKGKLARTGKHNA